MIQSTKSGQYWSFWCQGGCNHQDQAVFWGKKGCGGHWGCWVLYCRGPNSSAFDEKGVFFSFFYIFAHFSPFAINLCVSVTNLSLSLRFSSNLRAHHKNYGKWWKIDKNVEKDEKFTFFVKIGGIRSPTIQLFVKIGFLFNSGKYWLKTVKSGSDIW